MDFLKLAIQILRWEKYKVKMVEIHAYEVFLFIFSQTVISSFLDTITTTQEQMWILL